MTEKKRRSDAQGGVAMGAFSGLSAYFDRPLAEYAAELGYDPDNVLVLVILINLVNESTDANLRLFVKGESDINQKKRVHARFFSK